MTNYLVQLNLQKKTPPNKDTWFCPIHIQYLEIRDTSDKRTIPNVHKVSGHRQTDL